MSGNGVVARDITGMTAAEEAREAIGRIIDRLEIAQIKSLPRDKRTIGRFFAFQLLQNQPL